MGAFEHQRDVAIIPREGHFKMALEPRDADVMGLWLQPERHLDVSRHTVRRVLGSGEPGFIENSAGPLGLDGYGIADSLPRQRTRKVKRPGERTGGPAFGEATVVLVEFKTPRATK